VSEGSGRATACTVVSRTSTSLLCSTAAADVAYTARTVTLSLDAALIASSSSASYQFLPDPVVATVLPQRGVFRCALAGSQFTVILYFCTTQLELQCITLC